MNGNGGVFVPAEQMGFCSQQRWNLLTVVDFFLKCGHSIFGLVEDTHRCSVT